MTDDKPCADDLAVDVAMAMQAIAPDLLRQMGVEYQPEKAASTLRRTLTALSDAERRSAGSAVLEGLAKVAFHLLGPAVLRSVAQVDANKPISDRDALRALLNIAAPTLETFDSYFSEDDDELSPFRVSDVVAKLTAANTGIDTGLFETIRIQAGSAMADTIRRFGGIVPTGTAIRPGWFEKSEALANALSLRDAYRSKGYEAAFLNEPFFEFFGFDRHNTNFSKLRIRAKLALGEIYDILYNSRLSSDLSDTPFNRNLYYILVVAFAERYRIAAGYDVKQGEYLERLMSRVKVQEPRP